MQVEVQSLTEASSSNYNLIELLKQVLNLVKTEKRTLEKQIYKRPLDEKLRLNTTKLETIAEEIEPNQENTEICLIINESKPYDKQHDLNSNNTNSNVNKKRKLFSRNPFSYRFFYTDSNDLLDILSWFLLTFILIIGTALILNCISRFVDRSVSNILYLRFVSEMSNYFPLISTGFLMIIFVLFSFIFRACLKKKKLVYFFSTCMFLFSILTYLSSIIIINTRINLESVVKDKLIRSIQNYDESIDLLQSKLHCCGVEKFTDWFETEWANNSLAVPLSCCIDPTSCTNKNVHSDEVYQKGCRSELTLFFQKYYGDYLIGGFGICCTILLKVISLCSCYFVHMKWQNLLRSSSHNHNTNMNIQTIVQLNSNSKNIA